MPTISELAAHLDTVCDVVILDDTKMDTEVIRLAGLTEAGPGSLAFARGRGPNDRTPATRASALIVDSAADVDVDALRAAGVVLLARADNPRLEFARVAERFFRRPAASGVHPSAVVHPDAMLAETCVICAGAYVGRSTIGKGTVIGEGARILDDVTIGDNCVIHPNATLGGDGFGFERDEGGMPVKFPQRGRIIIGDRVEIGANTCVDRGALSDTVIADDSKIDNLVHIAHNVAVGRGTLIAANAVIAGSAVLGERVWVGPSVTVSDGLTVGDDAKLTLGSIVTHDVPAGSRVTGNFAVDHDRFLAFMRSIR